MADDRGEGLELMCLLDSVQGLVDALTCIRWKRHQDAICELSEHGVVIMVEEWSCLQARVYFRKELFRTYVYQADVRPRFGVSLGLLVDSLSTFTSSTGTAALELQYPGPDMQLLLKSIDANETCMYAEIRTRIPDTIPRDFSTDEDNASSPQSFAVKSAALKEAIDDLEWPGSSVKISLCPEPPSVIFRAEGHGDLQVISSSGLQFFNSFFLLPFKAGEQHCIILDCFRINCKDDKLFLCLDQKPSLDIQHLPVLLKRIPFRQTDIMGH